MQLKFLLVCFLAVSLLVSMTEAGKDRRKKQKQKERNEDDDTNEEGTAGKGLEDSGKAKEDKERTSVLEKQSEKKGDDDESSSEEKDDEDDKKNATVIIRKKRNDETVLSRMVRESLQPLQPRIKDEDAYILPTDATKFIRDTSKQIQKAQELNDGAQIPLEKKPSATASPSK